MRTFRRQARIAVRFDNMAPTPIAGRAHTGDADSPDNWHAPCRSCRSSDRARSLRTDRERATCLQRNRRTAALAVGSLIVAKEIVETARLLHDDHDMLDLAGVRVAYRPQCIGSVRRDRAAAARGHRQNRSCEKKGAVTMQRNILRHPREYSPSCRPLRVYFPIALMRP